MKRKALRCHASQPKSWTFTDQERYFRDLDQPNASLPESDLFAGITNHGPDLPR